MNQLTPLNWANFVTWRNRKCALTRARESSNRTIYYNFLVPIVNWPKGVIIHGSLSVIHNSIWKWSLKRSAWVEQWSLVVFLFLRLYTQQTSGKVSNVCCARKSRLYTANRSCFSHFFSLARGQSAKQRLGLLYRVRQLFWSFFFHLTFLSRSITTNYYFFKNLKF